MTIEAGPGDYRATARMNGYRPQSVRILARALGEHHAAEFVLSQSRGKSLILQALVYQQVADDAATRRPIAGVTVQLRQGDAASAPGTTDAQGRTRLLLGPGDYQARASPPLLGSQTLHVSVRDGGANRAVFIFKTPAPLPSSQSGKCRPNATLTFVAVVVARSGAEPDTPLSGATVRLSNPGAVSVNTTDSRGRVRLRVPAGGDYVASAVKDGYAVRNMVVTITESGKNHATFVLRPLPTGSSNMASLDIRVVDASSRKPIPGATVLILGGSRQSRQASRTCSAGDLSQVLPRGDYEVIVRNQGYQPRRESVSLSRKNARLTVMLVKNGLEGRGDKTDKRNSSSDRNAKTDKNRDHAGDKKPPKDGKTNSSTKPAKGREVCGNREPAKEDRKPIKPSKAPGGQATQSQRPPPVAKPIRPVPPPCPPVPKNVPNKQNPPLR